MNTMYTQLAERQHGYLLVSQIAPEDTDHLRSTGFLVGDSLDEWGGNVYATSDYDFTPRGRWYAEWLSLMPDTAPHERLSPPVFVHDTALRFYELGILPADRRTISVEKHLYGSLDTSAYGSAQPLLVSPISDDQWEYIDGIPVQRILPALQWLAEYFRGGEFDWVSYAYIDAYCFGGQSFGDLASTLVSSADTWSPDDPTPEGALINLLGSAFSDSGSPQSSRLASR